MKRAGKNRRPSGGIFGQHDIVLWEFKKHKITQLSSSNNHFACFCFLLWRLMRNVAISWFQAGRESASQGIPESPLSIEVGTFWDQDSSKQLCAFARTLGYLVYFGPTFSSRCLGQLYICDHCMLVLPSLADYFWGIGVRIISAAGENFGHFEVGNAIF